MKRPKKIHWSVSVRRQPCASPIPSNQAVCVPEPSSLFTERQLSVGNELPHFHQNGVFSHMAALGFLRELSGKLAGHIPDLALSKERIALPSILSEI